MKHEACCPNTQAGMSRRRFVAAAATGLLYPGGVLAARDRAPHYRLTAVEGRQRLDPELPMDTDTWSYNGQVPGPMMQVQQGSQLIVDFRNELAVGSAIHWHGIRIVNAMDGAVGLTQSSVLPGETFCYKFTVPDAGTYWYHAHQNSSEQVGRGLYGVLIVDEPHPPDVDEDRVLVLDDWRLDSNGKIQGPFGNLHDIAHAGRIGNWLTVNGQGRETVVVRRGSRLRLRLVNCANSLIMSLQLPSWNIWVAALDGMPLTNPVPAESVVVLAPGQRMDLIADVKTDAALPATLDFHSRHSRVPLVHFLPTPGPAQPMREWPPEPLAPNPVHPAAAVADHSVRMVLQGGARGDLRQAEYQGQMHDLRTLARMGKAWAQNGVVGRSVNPLLSAPRGSTQEVVFDNRTAWPHAMHLHGHHFLVPGAMAGGGLAAVDSVLRDTVLVMPGETLAVRFRADNPGKWLLHCHMLEHQMGGMVTWIEVV